MLGMIQRRMLAAVERCGYVVTSRRRGPTLVAALARLRGRGPDPFRSVIDVGASDGRWSEEAMRAFPSAEYFLIEAQPVHRPALDAFCRRHSNTRYVLAAAGDADGETEFNANDPFGCVASRIPVAGTGIRVPMRTIDSVVASNGLQPPYLIKLDTHGFELPILQGAASTLADTSVLVVECYNFTIAPECLLFPDMCRHLGGLGFRPADVFDLLYRPRDGLLWQMDVLFLKADRPEFGATSYD